MNSDIALEKLQQSYKNDKNFRICINSCFQLACENMNIDLIDSLVMLGVDTNNYIKAFNAMCFAKNINGAEQLLQKFNIQDEKSLIKLFELACTVGAVDVINRLITEKNVKYHLESIDPFVNACNKKQIKVAKFLLANCTRIYDDNEVIPSFVNAAGHSDSIMLNFLLDCKLNITASLHNAAYQACRTGSKNNILKIIDLGADVSDIKVGLLSRSNKIDLCEILEPMISSENYLIICNNLCEGYEEDRINIIQTVLQKYATNEDVPIICNFLLKTSKTIIVRIFQKQEFVKLILDKNYKFFIDVFMGIIFDERNTIARRILTNIGLTEIQMYVLCTVATNIDYTIFANNIPDDFILYVLFKRNDLKSFVILQKMYPEIQFEFDEKGNLINYDYYNRSVKSARNI